MKYIGLFDEKEDIVTKEKLDAKQDKITVSCILKGDGAGGVSAAVANTDYATCTNLRNGSAEGSIRTISATEESSAYTIGGYALAEGYDTRSSGNYSHAEGFKTNASGEYSHAEAYRTKASGAQSHAEGSWTQALDSSSHSEGNRTIASAEFSHAEGDSTTAQGKTSHSEGTETIANHLSQHVQGEYNIADASTAVATERGNYAHIVGNGTSDTARSNAHTLDWSGNAWFAGDVYVGSTSGTNKDDGSQKLVNSDEVAMAISDASETYFATQGLFESNNFTVLDVDSLSGICYELNNRIATSMSGESIIPLFDIQKPCLIIKYLKEDLGNSQNNIILKYNGIGSIDESSKFTGIWFDVGAMEHYAISVEWDFRTSAFINKKIDKIEDKIFVATYGTTTYSEIKTAYRAGKIVICARSTGLDSTDYYFYELSAQALPGLGDPYIQFSLGKYYVRVTTNNVWSNGVHNPTINGKTLTDTTNLELGSTTNATLSSSDWATSGAWKTQTVSVTGLKASYNAAPFVDVALSGTDAAADAELAAAWLGISASAIANTAANSLTVKFPATVDTPTVNIPIRITTYD